MPEEGIFMKIILGITGASGVIMGYKMLLALKSIPDCEIHLVISEGGIRNFRLETDLNIDKIKTLADYYYDDDNLAALISSGSFVTDGMILIPCSMKTLSAIATGYAANLIARAADVCLKENRKVVLVPREMPLGKIHLRNMYAAVDIGCTLIPPMFTFYKNPQSLDDQIDHLIGKILMQFGIVYQKFSAWSGR
ncbi:MAG: UbiX family flavin prenyltransferase [Dethiobacteria bacterium]|jgi:4-hydroxy-3-polyprenylbenzoate decarboxylase